MPAIPQPQAKYEAAGEFAATPHSENSREADAEALGNFAGAQDALSGSAVSG